jgi:hypothetical protein
MAECWTHRLALAPFNGARSIKSRNAWRYDTSCLNTAEGKRLIGTPTDDADLGCGLFCRDVADRIAAGIRGQGGFGITDEAFAYDADGQMFSLENPS